MVRRNTADGCAADLSDPGGLRDPAVGSTRFDPNGGEFSFTFDDPDPGWIEGDLMAMTTATFALAMAPGEYNIDMVSIANAAAPGEPTELWLGPVWGMSPGPKFTVPAEAECSFMGQITLIYFRLPAGDVASQFALIQEITGGAEVSVQLDPEGTYLFQDVGLDLFADEGELALPGKRRFHDGDEIDVSSCADLPAEF